MEVKIHKTQEENEKLERRLKEVEDLGKRKDDEILDVKSKVRSFKKLKLAHFMTRYTSRAKPVFKMWLAFSINVFVFYFCHFFSSICLSIEF